jgi:hypothetical protein
VLSQVSTKQDPARLIADRVARRLAADATGDRTQPATRNEVQSSGDQPRARLIDFVSASPPGRVRPSIVSDTSRSSPLFEPERQPVSQVAQSPWLAPFTQNLNQIGAPAAARNRTDSGDHPSQERFGVEEAAVSELVEFFENEKQCSVDPSGKPCDHCAMCSSRGF